MRTSIRTDRNLTVRRSGYPADTQIRLIFWDGERIADVFEGPVPWLCRQFNLQRVHCIEPHWTATIETVA
jgi:hypothetical protein